MKTKCINMNVLVTVVSNFIINFIKDVFTYPCLLPFMLLFSANKRVQLNSVGSFDNLQ